MRRHNRYRLLRQSGFARNATLSILLFMMISTRAIVIVSFNVITNTGCHKRNDNVNDIICAFRNEEYKKNIASS